MLSFGYLLFPQDDLSVFDVINNVFQYLLYHEDAIYNLKDIIMSFLEYFRNKKLHHVLFQQQSQVLEKSVKCYRLQGTLFCVLSNHPWPIIFFLNVEYFKIRTTSV